MPSSIVRAPREADPSQPARPSQLCWTLVSIATLTVLGAAAAVLRFSFLTRKTFWFDECFSVEVARLGWTDFWRLMWRREANMSLYYLFLRGWLHLGSSPYFIRSLSVIISLATLPAIFWLASQLFNRRAGLLAVALMSFNAFHIRYAQEARSYSLFVLLAILSSGFFVAALREPSRRNRVGYVLASVLAVYAHLYALLLLAAQWLSVRGEKERMSSRPLRRTWIWIGFASLPLIVFAAKTGAGPIRWIQRPGFHDLLHFVEQMAGNDGLPLLFLYAAACLAAILPYKGTTRWFRTEAKSDGWSVRFLLIWLLFPVVLTLLLSLARPLFLGRYFLFCLPALVILAAAGLAKLRPVWVLGVGLGVMLLLSLQGTFSYYDHDFDLERDGSEAAASYILDHAQPGDAILFHIAEARVPYEFFRLLWEKTSPAGSPAEPEIIYPRHGDNLDYQDFSGKPTSAFVHSIPEHYSRVWVVLMSNQANGHPDPTTLMLNRILGESFPRVEEAQFPQVEVRVYSKR
ncbi:MAG TPA: glycosyltransferase family 39 protein [Candidatus Deferrimicrobiaceae bacterium]|nr:glycosyltransferase family 39 protein [Candidatus Deferrimicrobiaceae bacterium]